MRKSFWAPARLRHPSVRWMLGVGLAAIVASPVAHAADANASFEDAVLGLINAERAATGLHALLLDLGLDAAAEAHSLDMATTPCFQHDSCNGGNWATRVRSHYTANAAIGEIIAAGYTTPEAVVAGWMASPGHRANILDGTYKVAGVSLVTGTLGYRSYWTVDFGGALTKATVVPEPATWALMGLGLAGVAAVARRRPSA